ncbi:hypothetical protein FQR65_LT09536 [Abscondita terminalis]|nr:hypothetical protein FQR65_LT09536 [Abscondita terminalis]
MESEEYGNFSSISFDNKVAQRVIPDVVFTLVCMVAVMANSSLIYTILKFKRLHTVPNLILANWAIADLVTLLTTPSFYRLIAILDHVSLSGMFMCSLYGIGAASQICRAIRKCKRRALNYPTVMLTVTTSFVLSWFAAIVNLFVMFGFGIFHRIVEGSSDFQACLSRLFRRNKSNYEEADFNFHSTGRKPIAKNISHCSFNNKEQNVFVY